MLFKGNKKGKMMSESLFLNLFVCVFFMFAWTMKNDCFRVSFFILLTGFLPFQGVLSPCIFQEHLWYS